MIFNLINISKQHVTLVRIDSDNNLEYVLVKPNAIITINSLSEYVNLANLLDPYKGIFKVSTDI